MKSDWEGGVIEASLEKMQAIQQDVIGGGGEITGQIMKLVNQAEARKLKDFQSLEFLLYTIQDAGGLQHKCGMTKTLNVAKQSGNGVKEKQLKYEELQGEI